MLSIFLILLAIGPMSRVRAQTCPDCPKDGIWSEWTESAPCATTCGSCSTTTKTRTCLSDTTMNCPCVGPTTKTAVCNTQACNMPRTALNQNLTNCCHGTPQIINNWYHCAPIEPELKLECCKPGGYWSTWTTFEKIRGKIAWSRSRTCLSGGHKCPCTGEAVETTYSCPCTPIQLITASDNPCKDDANFANFIPFTVRPLGETRSQCQMTFVVEATNFRYNFTLNTLADPTKASYPYATLVGVVEASTNQCQPQFFHVNEPANSNKEPAPTGKLTTRDYTCNLTTLLYDGHTKFGIIKMGQFYRAN